MGRVKHGIYPWIKQGQLPSIRGKKKVKAYLDDLELRIVNEFGGIQNISPQQEILIHSTIKILGIQILIELYLNKVESPFKKNIRDMELLSVLGRNYLAYANTLRQNLLALGLNGRKADNILTPLGLGKEIDAEKAKSQERGSHVAQAKRIKKG